MTRELESGEMRVNDIAARMRLWNVQYMLDGLYHDAAVAAQDPEASLFDFNHHREEAEKRGGPIAIGVEDQARKHLEGVRDFVYYSLGMTMGEELFTAISENRRKMVRMTEVDEEGDIWFQVLDTFAGSNVSLERAYRLGRDTAISRVLTEIQQPDVALGIRKRDSFNGQIPRRTNPDVTEYRLPTILPAVDADYLYIQGSDDPVVMLHIEPFVP